MDPMVMFVPTKPARKAAADRRTVSLLSPPSDPLLLHNLTFTND
jgi:hypothetical protein